MTYTDREIADVAISTVRAQDIEDINLTTRASITEAATLLGIAFTSLNTGSEIVKYYGKVELPIDDSSTEFEQACTLGAFILHGVTPEDLNEVSTCEVLKFASYAIVPSLVSLENKTLASLIEVSQRTDIPFEALRSIFI